MTLRGRGVPNGPELGSFLPLRPPPAVGEIASQPVDQAVIDRLSPQVPVRAPFVRGLVVAVLDIVDLRRSAGGFAANLEINPALD